VSQPEDKPDFPAPPSLVRPLLWTFAFLSAAYLPLFFGKIFFFRDIAHWAFPARAFLRDSLARGELPVWNPLQGLGFPVFGEPLYGIFYPPNWLFLLVGSTGVAEMLNWQYFIHLAWGTAGVCWLARRLGASRAAIIVAGLAWALSGYTTAQWTSGILVLADAWVPWAMVGQVALLDSLRLGGLAWRRGMVKAALPVLFAVLLGEIFLAMIGAAFGLLFAAVLHRNERRADDSLPRARPAWLLRACLAVALGFGVGAIVILPAYSVAGNTERSSALPREMAERCSFHPLRIAEFVLPNSMGNAYGNDPAASIVGEPKLDGLPLSYSVYLGASVAALALAALGRRRRLSLALLGLGGMALLLAAGKYTPVHGIFRRVVFPLSYMRYPEKYLVLWVATVALLGGLGAKRVLSQEPQPWRRNLVLLVLVVGLGLLAYFVLPPAWMVYAVRGALLGSLAILGVLAAQFLAARGSSLAPLLLVALVAFDLAAAAWPLQGFGGSKVASDPPYAAHLALRLRSSPIAPPRVYRSNQTTGSVNRWVGANSNTQGEHRLTSTLITNTVNAWGIAALPGYDAAIPETLNRLWNKGLSMGQSTLRLLGADFAVLPVEKPGLPGNDRPGLEPVLDPLPGARMYRVPGTLPRVFLARHAEVMSDEQALARIFEPDVIAGDSVWLAAEGDPQPLPSSPGRAGVCKLEAYENSRLVAECTARERGLVVFVEQYDRGWQATVDGSPARLFRANLIMRALPVEAGTHRIELHYRAPGLVPGATISLLCLLALGGLWLVGGGPKAARRRPASAQVTDSSPPGVPR
jgi:hypothetical protein